MPRETDNPLIMVYDALWALAESSSRLTDLVRLKNRIKFNQTGQSSPVKEDISNADLPELILVCTGGSGNLHNTSSTSSMTRRFEWIISTGDASISNKLLPVEWALYCAMISSQTTLGALRWPSDATDGFCKVMRMLDIETGQADAERNRGIAGWSSVWGVEVEMHFRSSDCVAVGDMGSGS